MDSENMTEENQIRLGADLLALATDFTTDAETVELYNNILEMPGIDAALWMLYKAAEGAMSHPKPLLQSAFMLGYYVHQSLDTADKLWESGLTEEPETSEWTKKAIKKISKKVLK